MAKIMLFLTGNAEGFRVSERTICNRCNISESGYKKARKKLAEKQWIFHKAGEYIQVNFNKIFSDYKAYEAGCPQNDSQDDPQETEEKVDVRALKTLSNPSEVFSVQATGNTEKTEGGFPQNTYNNINNNINNIIKNINDPNSITGNCEDTRSEVACATSPQASSQSLREVRYSREEMKNAERKLQKWYNDTYGWITCVFDMDDEEERKTVESLDEYKAFLIEFEEKREEFKAKYNCYPIIKGVKSYV